MAVTFTFGWPEGLALAVVEEREESRTEGAVTQRWRTQNRFTLRVERWGTERRVRAVDHERDVLEHPSPPPGVFDHKRLTDFVREAWPAFVVDDEGHVESIPNDELAALARAVAPPASLGPLPPALQTLVERIASPAAALAAVRTNWNGFVGGLVGWRLVEGERAHRSVREPVPALGGATLAYEVQAEIVEALPDGRVHVWRRIVPSAASGARMAEAMVASGTGGLRVTRLESTSEVDVLCDPSTLVPTWCEARERKVAEVTHPDQGVRLSNVEETRRWRFDGSGDA